MINCRELFKAFKKKKEKREILVLRAKVELG